MVCLISILAEDFVSGSEITKDDRYCTGSAVADKSVAFSVQCFYNLLAGRNTLRGGVLLLFAVTTSNAAVHALRMSHAWKFHAAAACSQG